MSRVVRLALWLLVALWLPATWHCQLEAAGFGESHHDDCCTQETVATGTDCLGDACVNVETSLIKESVSAFNLAAPGGDCLLCCAALVCTDERGVEPPLSPARHAPPLELKVAWQFSERAAPPARAPGPLNA